jgi:hypothetical protein
MAEERESGGLFRQEALEQISSVEQLDQLIQIVNLKDWIPLASVGFLVAIALIWSVFGRIPTTVSAKGLLLQDPANPNQLVNVSYFPIGEGKRIRPGDSILITPDVVSASETGGIKATVTDVSAAPVTEETLLQKINGNRELANLVYTPASIQVVAQLESDSSNASGYQWSMSQGPESRLSSQTPTTARAVLSRTAPISFVFPFLK